MDMNNINSFSFTQAPQSAFVPPPRALASTLPLLNQGTPPSANFYAMNTGPASVVDSTAFNDAPTTLPIGLNAEAGGHSSPYLATNPSVLPATPPVTTSPEHSAKAIAHTKTTPPKQEDHTGRNVALGVTALATAGLLLWKRQDIGEFFGQTFGFLRRKGKGVASGAANTLDNAKKDVAEAVQQTPPAPRRGAGVSGTSPLRQPAPAAPTAPTAQPPASSAGGPAPAPAGPTVPPRVETPAPDAPASGPASPAGAGAQATGKLPIDNSLAGLESQYNNTTLPPKQLRERISRALDDVQEHLVRLYPDKFKTVFDDLKRYAQRWGDLDEKGENYTYLETVMHQAKIYAQIPEQSSEVIPLLDELLQDSSIRGIEPEYLLGTVTNLAKPLIEDHLEKASKPKITLALNIYEKFQRLMSKTLQPKDLTFLKNELLRIQNLASQS